MWCSCAKNDFPQSSTDKLSSDANLHLRIRTEVNFGVNNFQVNNASAGDGYSPALAHV